MSATCNFQKYGKILTEEPRTSGLSKFYAWEPAVTRVEGEQLYADFFVTIPLNMRKFCKSCADYLEK